MCVFSRVFGTLLNNIVQTQEFSARMRAVLRENMPVLMSRIYRPHNSASLPLQPPFPRDTLDGTARTEADASDTEEHWSWPAAQMRLAAAYDKDGISGWADAMVREVEAEAATERRRRSV
jgi:hypothetical protein